MKIYIQRKEGRNVETVDETDNRKEAKRLVAEYAISDHAAFYYTSQRATRGWK